MAADRSPLPDLDDLDFVVLAPGYPRPTRPGGEVVRTRVEAYRAAGLSGHVVDVQAPGAASATTTGGSVPVTTVGEDHLPAVVEALADAGVPVLAHSPGPALTRLLHAHVPGTRLALWHHGFEVCDQRRLLGYDSSDEVALLRSSRGEDTADRLGAAATVFADPAVTHVFVSEFQRRLAEWDVGEPARTAHVIPNHIDGDLYRARVRRPEEARSILLLRSFAERRHANDVALRALEILSRREGFADLRITVRGFGRHFDDAVAAVAGLPNVVIVRGYAGPAELAAAHYDHGVFLYPSRLATQGVLLGEAMASGLATITNPVAALPEFTDETCSLLPRADDPRAFADALWHLITHPDLMPVLSRNAARRVRAQCGAPSTIARELELIESLSG